MKHIRKLLATAALAAALLLTGAQQAPYVWTVDPQGNGTFNGNLTVNGQLNVAGPWAVSSPIPAAAFAPSTANNSSFGISNDGNLYLSSNGSPPAKVLTGAGLAKVATSGSYTDLLNQPVIPAAQVNSDWNATSGLAQILNKPVIPAGQVNADWNATSGMALILNKPAPLAVGSVISGKLTCAGDPGKSIGTGFSAACTFAVTAIQQ